jgi:hypothetical protein
MVVDVVPSRRSEFCGRLASVGAVETHCAIAGVSYLWRGLEAAESEVSSWLFRSIYCWTDGMKAVGQCPYFLF